MIRSVFLNSPRDSEMEGGLEQIESGGRETLRKRLHYPKELVRAEPGQQL